MHLLYLLLSVAEQAPAIRGNSNNLILILVGVFSALTGGGGLFAFRKARAESRKIAAEARKTDADTINVNVDAAQGAVLVQSGVIKDLQTQLDRQAKTLEKQRESCDKLEDENTLLTTRLVNITGERDKLKARLDKLELANE